MLQVQDAKMSKSLKNFFTLRDVMEKYSKEEIRFYVLSAHYRGPQVYSEAALDEAAASLKRISHLVRELRNSAGKLTGSNDAADVSSRFREKFIESMDQDFNSRAAISELFELVREANRLLSSGELSNKGAENILSAFNEMDSVFGILPESKTEDDSEDLIQILIDVRNELRKVKQYALADSIRDRLKECGIELQDSAEGVKWIRI